MSCFSLHIGMLTVSLHTAPLILMYQNMSELRYSVKVIPDKLMAK